MILSFLPIMMLASGVGLAVAVGKKRVKARWAVLLLTVLVVAAGGLERMLPLPQGPDDPFGLVLGTYGMALLFVWLASPKRRKSGLDSE